MVLIACPFSQELPDKWKSLQFVHRRVSHKILLLVSSSYFWLSITRELLFWTLRKPNRKCFGFLQTFATAENLMFWCPCVVKKKKMFWCPDDIWNVLYSSLFEYFVYTISTSPEYVLKLVWLESVEGKIFAFSSRIYLFRLCCRRERFWHPLHVIYHLLLIVDMETGFLLSWKSYFLSSFSFVSVISSPPFPSSSFNSFSKFTWASFFLVCWMHFSFQIFLCFSLVW